MWLIWTNLLPDNPFSLSFYCAFLRTHPSLFRSMWYYWLESVRVRWTASRLQPGSAECSVPCQNDAAAVCVCVLLCLGAAEGISALSPLISLSLKWGVCAVSETLKTAKRNHPEHPRLRLLQHPPLALPLSSPTCKMICCQHVSDLCLSVCVSTPSLYLTPGPPHKSQTQCEKLGRLTVRSASQELCWLT